MRTSGVIESTRRLGAHDHLCWSHDDHDSFVAEAVNFLAEGMAIGQRIAYVSPDADDVVLPRLSPLGDVGDLLDRGALRILGINEVYEPVKGATPAAQAALYSDAVGSALADGFTGLRVAAEATALVADPVEREAFVRYEHLVDRLMAGGLRFAAMCGYDTAILGRSAAGEVAAVHPLNRRSEFGFAMFATGTHDLALIGEVDAMTEPEFGRTAQRVLDAHRGSTVTLDCSGLSFIDHRGLLALERAAHDAHISIRLAGAPAVVGRVQDLLPLHAVEVATLR